ncbi:MAG TPA: metallophosphoesterase [Vicinamibacteria bacterium]
MATTRLQAALAALAWLSAAASGSAQTAVVAAAGDIACDPADPNYNGGVGTAAACHMRATSDLLAGTSLDAVLVLGDNQYEDGAFVKYQASFDPSWGRLKPLIRPVPGNHEYVTPGAGGYYAYFGAAAGDPARGYYSYDLGAWHLIALNSNCAQVGGCGPGSPQEQWLGADLAAHAGRCLLAYWHHPRFSSGSHGNDPAYDAFWQRLYQAQADVVLVGHDHLYERFAPQAPSGVADPARGIRQFVVGTGGKNHVPVAAVKPSSEVRDDATFGVLRLTLRPDGYDWQFVPDASGTFTDAGSGTCHAAQGGRDFYTVTPCRLVDTRDPPGPAGGPALAAGSTRVFLMTGRCGIPTEATALALNVTVVSPTAAGHLRLFPAGPVPPLASAINFAPGLTRANNAVATLSTAGETAVRCDMAAPAGTVHLVVDVTGYFR